MIADNVREKAEGWAADHSTECPRILVDQTERVPYKRFQESKGPLNQIMMKTGSGKLEDVAKLSKVVASIETFKLLRLYAGKEDVDAAKFIEQTIKEEVNTNG